MKSKKIRKGTLSNGLWKWINIKDKFIVLKKKKGNKMGCGGKKRKAKK